MLDIQFIRENPELVQEKAKQKGYDVDVSKLLEADKSRRELLARVEELRQKRNENAAKMKGGKPDQSLIDEGKNIKVELAEQETYLAEIEVEYQNLLETLPNTTPDDTPLGGEEDNVSEFTWGETQKDFEPIDHLAWGERRGVIDFERGAKVAGSKFYFLKDKLVDMELALFQFGLQTARKYGFTPITVPHIVNGRTAAGTGYLPRDGERDIYKIEDEDLNLIATAEIPITGYHADEIIEGKDLPLLYVGLSPAYRLEAGAYGKFSKGLYRVHQFNKLELYVFCKPEDSEHWHQELVKLEEELCQQLGIPYQRVRIAAGDLGAPAYKKYDIEYWSPVDKAYRELMSCSNITDFQARRLNIRYRGEDGTIKHVHTLNGTAAAYSRMAIAIIENYQTAEGEVVVPEVLRPYMGNVEKL